MKQGNTNKPEGFTLVEMIIYIAIASVFFVMAVGFFWQVRQSEIRSIVSREVKENSAQVMEFYKSLMRNAQDVNAEGSQFGVNPGALEVTYSDGERILDTYTTEITVGGNTMLIRKVRITQNGNSYDLTSNHVTVNKFQINNFTQGDQPYVIQLELELESVNPDNNPNYDNVMTTHTTVNVRKEE